MAQRIVNWAIEKHKTDRQTRESPRDRGSEAAIQRVGDLYVRLRTGSK
jgi:hypothetical protein